jgi:PadR family transcriptional regulator, regulatory protein PadR
VLGRFEEAILVALINAKGEATIADVYEALADKLQRGVSFGAIYTTLDRMLDKKFVEVRKGEPLPERGGKARNYYRVTSGGRAAVIAAQRTTSALALPSLAANPAAS